MKTLTTLWLLCCSLFTPLYAQNGDQLFDPSYLHEIRFTFATDTFWNTLTDNYENYIDIDDTGTNVPYLQAIVEIDGTLLDTVGIRQKGLSSHGHATRYKKPFKVDINEFLDDQKYDGIKKFNLHNGAMDPGMVRDFIAYNVHRTAGVNAPRMSFCKLYFNNEYWGIYGIIEQIDKTFVENHFSNGDGNLIKNSGWTELQWQGEEIEPYLEDFQMRTNEEEADWSAFLNFVDVLNNEPDETFATAIEKVFNVDLYLKVMAIDVLTNNWDSYIDNERNFYLYHHPEDNRFHWIPWDYNLSLGGTFSTSGNPYAPVEANCFARPTFTWTQTGQTYEFIDKSIPAAEKWYWEFGDGTTSEEAQPTHTFTNLTDTKVCLTVFKESEEGTCQQQRCKEIDLTFVPNSCETILNGTSPYPASDPAFQAVTRDDDFCCNDTWDALCEVKYYEVEDAAQVTEIDPIEIRHDFPIILDNPDKVLIHRLLNVPAFKQRYLDIMCLIKDNNFNAERLFPMIEKHAEMIRAGIYEDPNYIFTTDYFEYDLGDGSGGGGGARIPAVRTVLEQRFASSDQGLAAERHNCTAAFSPIAWHDMVINEVVASNHEEGGVANPSGKYSDWIELYNNSNQAIDLEGFFLTDNRDKPQKWQFPAGTQIAAQDYLVVWADKDEEEEGLHANFKLSKSGESLLLTHEDGTAIDSLTYDQQETNIAYARTPNGTGDFVYQTPTFMQNNNLVNSSGKLLEEEIFEIYPNPVSDYFKLNIKLIEQQKAQLSISDLLGRTYLKQNVNINSTQLQTINTAQLPAGIYMVKIQTNNRHLVQKITVL